MQALAFAEDAREFMALRLAWGREMNSQAMAGTSRAYMETAAYMETTQRLRAGMKEALVRCKKILLDSG
eukprot:6009090-Pyramimonas_sp.AAC.1